MAGLTVNEASGRPICWLPPGLPAGGGPSLPVPVPQGAAHLPLQPGTDGGAGSAHWSERRNLVFLLAVVVLWATEDFHPLTGTLVVAAATALMFPLGLLRLPDVKAINVKLLIFLTAAFAIGGTLKSCGVADRLFSLFVPVFPQTFSPAYAAVVLLTVVLLHTVLGR